MEQRRFNTSVAGSDTLDERRDWQDKRTTSEGRAAVPRGRRKRPAWGHARAAMTAVTIVPQRMQALPIAASVQLVGPFRHAFAPLQTSVTFDTPYAGGASTSPTSAIIRFPDPPAQTCPDGPQGVRRDATAEGQLERRRGGVRPARPFGQPQPGTAGRRAPPRAPP